MISQKGIFISGRRQNGKGDLFDQVDAIVPYLMNQLLQNLDWLDFYVSRFGVNFHGIQKLRKPLLKFLQQVQLVLVQCLAKLLVKIFKILILMIQHQVMKV